MIGYFVKNFPKDFDGQPDFCFICHLMNTKTGFLRYDFSASAPNFGPVEVNPKFSFSVLNLNFEPDVFSFNVLQLLILFFGFVQASAV